jgi:hypothetical protein
MNLPLPEHHSNPETSKNEPVFIFTDKAVVPPPKPPRPPQPEDKGENITPKVDPPAEEDD